MKYSKRLLAVMIGLSSKELPMTKIFKFNIGERVKINEPKSGEMHGRTGVVVEIYDWTGEVYPYAVRLDKGIGKDKWTTYGFKESQLQKEM